MPTKLGWEVHEDVVVTGADPQTGEQVSLTLKRGRHVPKNEAEELLLRACGATPPEEDEP